VAAIERYKLKESVIYQEVGEEALLLDAKTEEVFSLNAVARDIWLAVQRTNSLDAAVAELILLYKVDEIILRRDAVALLKSNREAGLLE
jgi:hypothetical protein